MIKVKRSWNIYAALNVTASSVPTLLASLAMRSRSTIKLEDIDINFGLDDDPTDERVLYYLVACDPDNLPSFVSLQNANYWNDMQIWRAVGTPANVLNTVDNSDDEDLRGEVTHDVTIPNHSLCLIAVGNVASSVRVQGVVDFTEMLEQRKVRDDSSEWQGYSWAESAYAS